MKIPAPPALSILAIVPDGPNRSVLGDLSHRAGWSLSFTTDPFTIASPHPAVILFDRRLPLPDWRRTLRLLTSWPSNPCVILVSPTADHNLWQELERFGGADILRSPVDPEIARRIISLAALLWQSQQHARLLLTR